MVSQAAPAGVLSCTPIHADLAKLVCNALDEV